MNKILLYLLPMFAKKLKPFCVGDRRFKPVMLAPMSGISDYPFRAIVRKANNSLSSTEPPFLTFSEMVASKAVIEDLKDARKLRGGSDLGDLSEAGGMVVQLAGTDADLCAEAARIVADKGALGIDLNFGCPARNVVRKASGSALMRDEGLCNDIFKAVVNAVSVPVSVKMRLGWDDESLNAPLVAKMAEDAGAHAVTVHGRTRCQFYNGKANWRQIRNVVSAVAIPVIANGDIGTIDEARDALEQSGADGIMIGRKSVGMPWCLNEIYNGLKGRVTDELSVLDKRRLVIEHVQLTVSIYGEKAGLRMMRKHLIGYAGSLIYKGNKRTAFIKQMVGLEAISEIVTLIEDFFPVRNPDVSIAA